MSKQKAKKKSNFPRSQTLAQAWATKEQQRALPGAPPESVFWHAHGFLRGYEAAFEEMGLPVPTWRSVGEETD